MHTYQQNLVYLLLTIEQKDSLKRFYYLSPKIKLEIIETFNYICLLNYINNKNTLGIMIPSLLEIKEELNTAETIKGLSRTLSSNAILLLNLKSHFTFTTNNIQQLLYHLKYDMYAIPVCSCNLERKFHRYVYGYFPTCGNKVCKDKSKQKNFEKTCLEKYGVKSTTQLQSTKDKYKDTMLERHGVSHNMKGHMRKSYEDSISEKYGSDIKSPLQIREIQDKRNETCIEKFGSLDFFHSENAKQTNINKYGFEHAMQNQDFAKSIGDKQSQNKLLTLIGKIHKWNCEYKGLHLEYNKDIIYCNRCKTETYHNRTGLNARLKSDVDICHICNPFKKKKGTSNAEIEIQNYIKELLADSKIEIHTNRKFFLGNGQELDICIPSKNIAFEYNGVYWHDENRKTTKYHVDKSDLCLTKGIKLIHIWEDDYILKPNIVKSQIKAALNKIVNKIAGRSCIIKKITYKESIQFFIDNHIQGVIPSKITYGLFYNGELVQAMSFSRERKILESKSREDCWELLRFATKVETIVIGGASKIFSHFIKEHNPLEIISYCDKSRTPDPLQSVYHKHLKMSYEKTSTVNYYYVIDGIRMHRLNFTRKRLIELNYHKNIEDFSKDTTEHDIMLFNKIFRIYDCGSHKFIWRKP